MSHILQNYIQQIFCRLSKSESKKKNRGRPTKQVLSYIFADLFMKENFPVFLKTLLFYSILPQCESLYSFHVTQFKSSIICKYIKLSVTSILFFNFQKQVLFAGILCCLIGLGILFQVL